MYVTFDVSNLSHSSIAKRECVEKVVKLAAVITVQVALPQAVEIDWAWCLMVSFFSSSLVMGSCFGYDGLKAMILGPLDT